MIPDRRNNFDLLRLAAALTVVLTHAFLIGEGRQDQEPLMWLTGGQCPLGVVGVFVFFTISGYLVTQSFENTRATGRFLVKRALRIYPGLALCLVLLAFGLGPALTALPVAAYFATPDTYGFVLANLLFDADWNNLPQLRFTDFAAGTVVDGPLWSLPCEVLMYLMVAALGTLRLLRLRVIAALLLAGLVAVAFDTAASDLAFGSALWLLPFFAAGMALYTLRDKPIFAPRYALLAAAGLVAATMLGHFILLFPLFGSYLIIYLARVRRVPAVQATRFGDLSYGLYIYGWPVEQAVTYLLGGSAPWWQVLGLSLPPSLALAALSWHLVEAPALRLKPGARRAVALEPVAAQ